MNCVFGDELGTAKRNHDVPNTCASVSRSAAAEARSTPVGVCVLSLEIDAAACVESCLKLWRSEIGSIRGNLRALHMSGFDLSVKHLSGR